MDRQSSAIARWPETREDVNDRPDSEIESAFAARRSWALDALYVRHAKTFYTAAFSVLRDREDAQDCVHDVLLRLWRSPQSYEPRRGGLKAFVSVCIRNDALDRLRISARAPGLRARLSARIEDETFEPFDHVEHDRLMRALRALPAAQRSTVALAYFHHLTHREVAERLQEPLGTVKSRISSAMRKLHELLTEDSRNG